VNSVFRYIFYYNGLVAYIIIAEGVARTSKIYVGSLLDSKSYDIGSSIVVKNLNLFTVISNIEKIPYKGSTLCRSAGSSATLLSKKGK
jgi:ribosomal protein L2